MKLISKAQKSKIWASAREVDISQEQLYQIIYSVSEKEKMSDLSLQEAHQVIEILVKQFGASKGQYPKTKKTSSSFDNVIGKMTPGQKRKILALMYSLKWTESQLDNFSKKICKRGWKILTKELANNLIEGLKGIQEPRRKTISTA